ncbi:MAG: hypothetical protein AB1757_30745 [Acidobacteriota bacterium]
MRKIMESKKLGKRYVLSSVWMLMLMMLVPQTFSQSGDSLQERARRSEGGYIAYKEVNFGAIHLNLNGLIKQSNQVLIGTVLSNHCRLTTDERSINTLYKIRVDEVLKGALSNDRIVEVSLPGGYLSFNNDTHAEVRVTGGFRKLLDGRQYVLFLDDTIENGVFLSTGEAQGLFELRKDNRILPADMRPEHPLVKTYKESKGEDFLKAIREAVKKESAGSSVNDNQ